MKRRTFMKYNAIAAFSLTPLFAEMQHMHGMMNHGSSGSNVDSMNDMNPMNTGKNHIHHNIDTSFITLENENLPLLQAKDLSKEQALKPLTLLTNQSKKKGEFQASIEIKEKEVQIAKGKQTRFYTYNDVKSKSRQSFLAPKIEVFEGDRVKIFVKNSLKEPTTIHWHGLPVPPSQDGNPADAITPDDSRIYEFKLPNDCAGTYWYHPHPHHATAKQVYMGLAGAFVVKSRNDILQTNKESDWFITDLRLSADGKIPDNALSDWLDGREGEFVLINGQYNPSVDVNSMQRIRIYNACSARYLNLEIQDSSFVIIGTDGGLIEKPIEQKTLFLSPASRVEVLVKNTKKGSFKLINHLYDRDKMMPKDEPKILELASVNFNDINDTSLLPQKLRALPKLQKPEQQLEITMSEDHMKMHGLSMQGKDEIKQNLASMFLINNKVFAMNDIDLRVPANIVHDIVVTNKSHMDHPFHIHGTQFEVIEISSEGNITKPEFRALKDTVNVRPGESLRLRMKHNFKGILMFHCHILEHEDLGMMGNLLVE